MKIVSDFNKILDSFQFLAAGSFEKLKQLHKIFKSDYFLKNKQFFYREKKTVTKGLIRRKKYPQNITKKPILNNNNVAKVLNIYGYFKA